MAKIPITVIGYRCDRCSHEWVPNDYSITPKKCPKCGSHYWDVPKHKSAMTYVEFREKIKTTLQSANEPLTWTEVRTRASLPQLFPNNKWVRQMEADIRLQRVKDENGIIYWNLSKLGE